MVSARFALAAALLCGACQKGYVLDVHIEGTCLDGEMVQVDVTLKPSSDHQTHSIVFQSDDFVRILPPDGTTEVDVTVTIAGASQTIRGQASTSRTDSQTVRFDLCPLDAAVDLTTSDRHVPIDRQVPDASNDQSQIDLALTDSAQLADQTIVLDLASNDLVYEPRYIFLAAEVQTGGFGIAFADSECNQQAHADGAAPTLLQLPFRALLGAQFPDGGVLLPKSILPEDQRPVHSPDHEVVASSGNDFWNSEWKAPANKCADATTNCPTTVWTGFVKDGTISDNCKAWTAGTTFTGEVVDTDTWSTSFGPVGCAAPASWLCVSQ